jgi:hypothetical protein
MSKWTLFATSCLLSLTIFGSFGCSNKKYEDAKGLADHGNNLRTDLSTNTPQATWKDSELAEYDRKIDEYQASIKRLNDMNGKDHVEVVGTEDAPKAIAFFRRLLAEARRQKAALAPINNSDNSEIVRFNQLDVENDRIYKELPRPEKGKGMEDLALSQMKTWHKTVGQILKNLKEQQGIAARNKVLVTDDKRKLLDAEVKSFNDLRDAVKIVMANKTSKAASRAN